MNNLTKLVLIFVILMIISTSISIYGIFFYEDPCPLTINEKITKGNKNNYNDFELYSCRLICEKKEKE